MHCLKKKDNFNGDHLNGAVVGGCGHVGVIGGETAVVDGLEVSKHGVLGGRLVEVPQLQRQRNAWRKERDKERGSRQEQRKSETNDC